MVEVYDREYFDEVGVGVGVEKVLRVYLKYEVVC